MLVKTAFQVLKLKFLACSKLSIYFANKNIMRAWQQEYTFFTSCLFGT